MHNVNDTTELLDTDTAFNELVAVVKQHHLSLVASLASIEANMLPSARDALSDDICELNDAVYDLGQIASDMVFRAECAIEFDDEPTREAPVYAAAK